MPASLRRFPYVQMKIFFILVVDGSMPLKKNRCTQSQDIPKKQVPKKVAERLLSDLNELVDSEISLLQQQIFNCIRMGLSRKRDTKENLHNRRGGINWAQANQ